VIPTRSALLELKDEHRAMKEGYAFLDEKRLLLAAEMVHQLTLYQPLNAEFLARHREAVEALRAVIARHGLEGTECLPAASLEQARLTLTEANLLGVVLSTAGWSVTGANPPTEPGRGSPNPSPEAPHCRRMFGRLVEQAAALAAVSGNLERLQREYRRTERRARALEDVLLPEIDQAVQQVEAALEDLDREEAIRARVHSAAG
jgi:V/A-type H+-transporting ATPase subunit D